MDNDFGYSSLLIADIVVSGEVDLRFFRCSQQRVGVASEVKRSVQEGTPIRICDTAYIRCSFEQYGANVSLCNRNQADWRGSGDSHEGASGKSSVLLSDTARSSHVSSTRCCLSSSPPSDRSSWISDAFAGRACGNDWVRVFRSSCIHRFSIAFTCVPRRRSASRLQASLQSEASVGAEATSMTLLAPTGNIWHARRSGGCLYLFGIGSRDLFRFHGECTCASGYRGAGSKTDLAGRSRRHLVGNNTR